MDFFRRMTESQTRHSSANLNKIKPDVACSNQHALPRPVINDGFSTASGEDLNNQSFLRLMAENHQIVLEKERLENELSQVQSQLTDSSAKLKMFQNVHIELATTKSQLEEKENLISDMTETNLHLTNENSRLRRKIDRDRLLESSRAIEKNLMLLNKERLVNHVNVLQTQLTSNSNLQMFQNLTIELAKTKSKLEKQKSLITDMTEKNLRLANDDSRLRRKVEDRDRLIASSQAEVEELKNCIDEQKLDKVHDMLAVAKRELELRNRSDTRLHKQNLRLMRNDKQLRRKLKSTNRFLESSRAESLRLRTALAEQQLDKVHEDLSMAKRELELGKRVVTRLEKRTFRLMRNDKWLKRKMENTNRLLLSGQAELKNLRVCITEQQLDTRELAKATRELESKNRTISLLEVKNVSLDENDSQLRRIEEPGTPVIEITEIKTACLASSPIASSRANENNLFVLDKERLENELSLLQSQLTDSQSKLQMFQNVHDELATTKSELEEKQSLIIDITGANLLLTKENSGLMRKIEAKDRVIAYKRTKLEQLHNCYEEKKLHKVHNELASSQRALVSKNRAITKLQEQNQESRAELEQLRTCLSEQQLDTLQLAVATRELESKTRTITELEAKNLSLAENDSQLRRKMEDDDRLLQSSQSALQQLQDELQQLLNNVPQLKQTMEDSGRLLLSSKVTIEELQLSLNKQTERVEQLVNQIRSKNEEVAELSNKNHQLELNDQRLRQIIEETKLLVVSSNDELENLRVCLAEQQLDKMHELTTATSEVESKNKIISELETENLRLAENDSRLRRKMEDSDLLLLSSKAEVEELRVSLNNQTERVKHLQDQVKNLDQEKEEAIRKLAELEAKQKEMKPKLTADVGCGSDEVINNPLRIENPIKIVKDTPIVVTAEPQPVHLSPARTEIESKAAQVSTEKPPDEFNILSSVNTEVYVDRIVVTGIANKDCGLVVGRHGSNAKRIEEQYWVSVSFINGNLFITGGDAESRQAACNDVIDILSVTIECPKINLRRNIFSEDYLLRELAFNHYVQIYRPCRENKYVTIWGTLANCRRVHKILQNGTR